MDGMSLGLLRAVLKFKFAVLYGKFTQAPLLPQTTELFSLPDSVHIIGGIWPPE